MIGVPPEHPSASGMSGFFARMAERAAGTERAVRLRPAQPFEAGGWGEVETFAAAEPVSASPGTPAVARPGARAVAVPSLRPASPPPQPRPEVHAPPARDVAAPVTVRAPRITAPAEIPSAATDAPREPVAALPPVVGPAPPEDAPAPPAGPERVIEVPAEPSAAPPPAPVVVAETPPPVRVTHVVRGEPQAPPPEVDVVTLLREHVVPVLVERGVVSRRERPVVAAARPSAPPRSGTVSIAPAAPAQVEPVAPEAGPPQVNVTIGRVQVTRAPSPRPPAAPAAPPRPSTVDHDAYLARRRAQR
jgi:hypothetical protein